MLTLATGVCVSGKKSPTSRAFALECSRALLYADIDSVLDDRLHVLLELMTTLGYEEHVFRLLKNSVHADLGDRGMRFRKIFSDLQSVRSRVFTCPTVRRSW